MGIRVIISLRKWVLHQWRQLSCINEEVNRNSHCSRSGLQRSLDFLCTPNSIRRKRKLYWLHLVASMFNYVKRASHAVWYHTRQKIGPYCWSMGNSQNQMNRTHTKGWAILSSRKCFQICYARLNWKISEFHVTQRHYCFGAQRWDPPSTADRASSLRHQTRVNLLLD